MIKLRLKTFLLSALAAAIFSNYGFSANEQKTDYVRLAEEGARTVPVIPLAVGATDNHPAPVGAPAAIPAPVHHVSAPAAVRVDHAIPGDSAPAVRIWRRPVVVIALLAAVGTASYFLNSFSASTGSGVIKTPGLSLESPTAYSPAASIPPSFLLTAQYENKFLPVHEASLQDTANADGIANFSVACVDLSTLSEHPVEWLETEMKSAANLAEHTVSSQPTCSRYLFGQCAESEEYRLPEVREGSNNEVIAESPAADLLSTSTSVMPDHKDEIVNSVVNYEPSSLASGTQTKGYPQRKQPVNHESSGIVWNMVGAGVSAASVIFLDYLIRHNNAVEYVNSVHHSTWRNWVPTGWAHRLWYGNPEVSQEIIRSYSEDCGRNFGILLFAAFSGFCGFQVMG